MKLNNHNLRAISSKLRNSLNTALNLCSLKRQMTLSKKESPNKIVKIKFRPDTAMINNREQVKLCDNVKFKDILVEEKALKFKKMKLRSKLLKLMNHLIILKKETVDYYNNEFKSPPIFHRRNKSSTVRSSVSSDLFNKKDVVYRYEDYYYSPEELLQKNFNDTEIKIIANDPKFFMLNRPPFKGINLQIQYSLKAKINEEEEEKEKKPKIHSNMLSSLSSSRKRPALTINNKDIYTHRNRISSLITPNNNTTKTKKIIGPMMKTPFTSRNKPVSFQLSSTRSTEKTQNFTN